MAARSLATAGFSARKRSILSCANAVAAEASRLTALALIAPTVAAARPAATTRKRLVLKSTSRKLEPCSTAHQRGLLNPCRMHERVVFAPSLLARFSTPACGLYIPPGRDFSSPFGWISRPDREQARTSRFRAPLPSLGGWGSRATIVSLNVCSSFHLRVVLTLRWRSFVHHWLNGPFSLQPGRDFPANRGRQIIRLPGSRIV